MGVLTGPEIARHVELGSIVIDPYDRSRLNPNSYNLRLADKLLVYNVNCAEIWEQDTSFPPDCILPGTPEAPNPWREVPGQPNRYDRVGCLDMKKETPTFELMIPEEGLILVPGVLYLGSTMEYTETPNFAPMIEGRSSVGRLGLCVHVTAGFGDRDFRGTWTLELTVVHPLRVYAGIEVCQIAYMPTVGEVRPYAGRYQGQRGPKPSGLWKDFAAEKGKKQP